VKKHAFGVGHDRRREGNRVIAAFSGGAIAILAVLGAAIVVLLYRIVKT